MRQLTTTPYHPICNGLVERFNGTLKQMLKKMCIDRPKDWDKYLPALLFAYRDVPQDSLGFSPFDLVYARPVRGPMTILKELWTKEIKDPEIKTTYQYVLDLRDRLESTCELVHRTLEESSARYKKNYDKKTRSRSLKAGEKVLILLPTDSNKLLMQWTGPFLVRNKLNRNDYEIDVNGKSKTFHINLLKQYVERDPEDGNLLSLVTAETIDDEQPIEYFSFPKSESYLNVDTNADLQESQQERIQEVLREYRCIH